MVKATVINKKFILILCSLTSMISLTACSSGKDAQKSTIEILKNGNVSESVIEDFAEDYYDSDELISFIDDTVSQYNDEHGKNSARLLNAEVRDDAAYLNMRFLDADVFSDFEEIECFSGSIIKAQTAGYDFDTDFYEVNGGVASDETVGADTVLLEDDLSALVIRGNYNLRVPGEIAFVSAEGTSILSKNTVAVSDADSASDEGILVYVLYK